MHLKYIYLLIICVLHAPLPNLNAMKRNCHTKKELRKQFIKAFSSRDWIKAAKFVASGEDIDIRPYENEDTLLLHYAGFTDLVGVQFLLNNGANVNAQNKHKHTPLHKVVFTAENPDYSQIISALIAAGANLELVCACGYTPLHEVIDNRKALPEHVDLLLKAGANVNGRTAKGNTALHLVSASCDSERCLVFAQKLIESGALVNAQNKEGETPLHANRLSEKMSAQMIAYLIEMGADIAIKDNRGHTPLTHSIELFKNFHESHQSVVRESIAVMITAFSRAEMQHMKPSVICLLIKKGENGSLPFPKDIGKLILRRLFNDLIEPKVDFAQAYLPNVNVRPFVLKSFNQILNKPMMTIKDIKGETLKDAHSLPS